MSPRKPLLAFIATALVLSVFMNLIIPGITTTSSSSSADKEEKDPLRPPPPPPSDEKFVKPTAIPHDINELKIDLADVIFKIGNDVSPIVVHPHKLIFFSIPKVACTEFKKLFQLMDGVIDKPYKGGGRRVHSPKYNNLTYIFHYENNITYVDELLRNYTVAVFVRDPVERFISAYFDKVVTRADKEFRRFCCEDVPDTQACVDQARTPEGFFESIQTCDDKHWRPQHKRMEPKYWNAFFQWMFIGYFENLYNDNKCMLEQIGAWDKFGSTGWGEFYNESMFLTNSAIHQTTAKCYLSRDLLKKVHDFYKGDYEMFDQFVERSYEYYVEAANNISCVDLANETREKIQREKKNR